MKSNSENKLQNLLFPFEKTTLSEIEKVKLMRRVDTKYVFNVSQLPLVLEELKRNYLVVEINGDSIQDYKTVYFDTSNYHYYLQHHNGIKNRYKVRFRTYVKSDLSFLEIKHKTNRKETIKSRLKQPAIYSELDTNHVQFINSKVNIPSSILRPSLNNTFKRITLVSKVLNERITIDSEIEISDPRNENEKKLHKLCIIETKRDFNEKNFASAKVLQSLRIKPSGFSKYCMGLALIHPTIKRNLFKPRLLRFQSILN